LATRILIRASGRESKSTKDDSGPTKILIRAFWPRIKTPHPKMGTTKRR
jgi:hypothetical protein